MRFYFYFLFFVSFSINAQNNLGCILEDIDTSRIQRKEYEITRDALPISYDLKKYAPPIMNQGELGSCTAWATAYAGFTINQRIENADISFPAASPLDLYNRLKVKENQDPCSDGSQIAKALALLKDYGCDNFQETSNVCKIQSATTEYENKLYDYEYLTTSTYNLKSALLEKNPIIISMPCYTDGWNNFYKLDETGVWNGEHDTVLKGYHAMCIVGYNDTVSSGAFLIMNSWGENWGKNGFFWLKYSDLSHISNSYVMYSNPEKKINQEQYFKVYNECSKTIYLSTSLHKEGGWISKGWYPAEPNSYVLISIDERDQDQFYWLATTSNNTLWWTDENNGKEFCIDPVNRFDYYDSDMTDCEMSKLFYSDEPGYSETYCIRTLSCPSEDTRGEKIVIANSESVKKSSNAVSNLNWKTGELLFDQLTGNVILSQKSIDGELYDIYFIKNKKIKNKLVDSQSLEKLRVLKFSSKENALKYLKLL